MLLLQLLPPLHLPPQRLSTRTLAFRVRTARVALAVAESGAAECSEGTVWLTREWMVKAGGCVKVSTDVSVRVERY